jgi:hypothetical protein
MAPMVRPSQCAAVMGASAAQSGFVVGSGLGALAGAGVGA